MSLLEERPRRPVDPRRAIDRQPPTTPISEPPTTINGDRCIVHNRLLSYREFKVGACSWCRPEAFGEAGAAEQGRLS